MKKWLAVAWAMLVAAVAWGEDALPDGGPYTNATADATWVFSVTNGAATLTAAVASGDAVVPDTLGAVSVTAIVDRAFQDCAKLSSVTIPSNVTSIGSALFANCTALKKVIIFSDSNNVAAQTNVFEDAALDVVTIVDPLGMARRSPWREVCATGVWNDRPIYYRGLEGVTVRIGTFPSNRWMFDNDKTCNADFSLRHEGIGRNDLAELVFSGPGFLDFDYCGENTGTSGAWLCGYVDYDEGKVSRGVMTEDLDCPLSAGASLPWQHRRIAFATKEEHTYSFEVKDAYSKSVCWVSGIKWTPIEKINPYENVTVELGATNVYSGAACTQTVERVLVDGVPIDFEVSDNVATNAGAYVMTILPKSGSFSDAIPMGYLILPRPISSLPCAFENVYDTTDYSRMQDVYCLKQNYYSSSVFGLHDEANRYLVGGTDYEVTPPSEFVESQYEWPVPGAYVFAFKGIGNYGGTTNFLVRIDKGTICGQQPYPSIDYLNL